MQRSLWVVTFIRTINHIMYGFARSRRTVGTKISEVICSGGVTVPGGGERTPSGPPYAELARFIP
jgi:hypothetical protein